MQIGAIPLGASVAKVDVLKLVLKFHILVLVDMGYKLWKINLMSTVNMYCQTIGT